MPTWWASQSESQWEAAEEGGLFGGLRTVEQLAGGQQLGLQQPGHLFVEAAVQQRGAVRDDRERHAVLRQPGEHVANLLNVGQRARLQVARRADLQVDAQLAQRVQELRVFDRLL